MPATAVTLGQYLDTAVSSEAGLVAIIDTLADAGVRIGRELGRAALVGQLGTTGATNVQGETVRKLDVWANDLVVEALTATREACTLISEEIAEPLHLDGACAEARYIVCFDPVDGSSNLDVNGIVGTIFSVRRRVGTGLSHDVRVEVAQPGSVQVAAGYVMYGPATQLVMTTGNGVFGFTFDPEAGQFVRTHDRIRIPRRGRTYSVNEGNTLRWADGIRRFVVHLRADDEATGRPYTARYAGSLVADVHRTLLDGGIFMYPADASARGKATGKLRLLYEAAPMAFIVEQAGGRASTGSKRILDVEPSAPHQRVPLLIGSPEDVALAEDFYEERR